MRMALSAAGLPAPAWRSAHHSVLRAWKLHGHKQIKQHRVPVSCPTLQEERWGYHQQRELQMTPTTVAPANRKHTALP